MTHTLTTERMDEIAKLAVRLQQISSCAAVTSSGETVMHHTFVDTILSALHDVTAELLANREAQPVAEVRLVPDICGCCQRPDVEWIGQQGRFFPVGTHFYTAPPAPAVPEEIPEIDRGEGGSDIDYMAPQEIYDMGKTDGWNACRAAMLAQPVSSGFKLVPVEPTEGMLAAAKEWTGLTDTAKVLYREMLAAAPEGGNG